MEPIAAGRASEIFDLGDGRTDRERDRVRRMLG